jgi:(4S)-4-hydroxy-5-phosphonooxypentane-2,3-dione isomerase
LAAPNQIAFYARARIIAGMLIVLVHVHVLPDAVEKFKEATRANAAASRREAGIAQFEMVQQTDDPTRFVLIEVYRTPDAAAAHKETEHYKTWRDTVAPMMAEPRVGVKYGDIDGAWK